MKIKRFEGKTEQEAMEKAKIELGLNPLILSIGTTQQKGMFSFFRSPIFCITAAIEDNKKNNFQEFLEKWENRDENIFSKEILFNTTINLDTKVTKKFTNDLVQMFYQTLSEQGVLEEVAQKILEELVTFEEEKLELSFIVKTIYNKIISILKNIEIIKLESTEGKPNIITFIGPTGVGKTTTIAKLSSILKLENGKNIGFITADTYRIAAIDQLKTYAKILGVDFSVAYNQEDLLKSIEVIGKRNEVIFVDTAGSSHKNEESIRELSSLLKILPESEIYLVLSITTKYEDLMNIINVYSFITDFKIIFTKIDETIRFGTLLNIAYKTNKKISYITTGQNVPDDIEVVKPEKIAKILMGMGGALSDRPSN